MIVTKKLLINLAYESIGLESYVYDLSPDQIQSTARKLDAMLASWETQGVRISWPFSNNLAFNNVNAEFDLMDAAIEAIYLNLGIRISASIGSATLPDNKSSAKKSYDTLLQFIVSYPQVSYPNTLPLGSGTKYWRYHNNGFAITPAPTIDVGPDDNLEL